MKLITLAALLALGGCVELRPETVSLEAEHVSHATQHEPFTSHPTAYGFDAVSVAARWEYGPAYVELSEGAILERCTPDWCGSLMGPREVFTGRVGINLWEKH